MSVKSIDRPAATRGAPRSPGGGGVNSAWVRRVNAVLVMQALRRHPGSSQRELAALTGLDKATVSAVVAQLAAAGLVARRAAPNAVRRLGRPAVALEIPLSAGLVFGVRLEPDGIAVAAADLAGRVVDRETAEGFADPGAAIGALKEAVGRLAARIGPVPQRAIGVGVPALIDASGRLLFGPNLRWRDVPLAERASAVLPMPAIVENDTNAAAIAEREFGCCGGVDDFIYISGHSGIGGAVFAGGRLYRGARGLAGEIGHIKVVAGGRPCACGGRGCLEAYASVPALLAILAERAAPARDIADMAKRAEAGEAPVLALLAETGALVGGVLAGLVNALNPSHLVLGGNLAIVAPWMLASLRQALSAAALDQLGEALVIERSPLGADAVLMGGVALALQAVDAELTENGPVVAVPRGP
jgi:predicted NBD/HSP70 family sugar kinase